MVSGSSGKGEVHLRLIWSLDLDANQVQIFVVKSLVGFPILALLPATSATLTLVIFLILIYDKACAFL